MRHGRVWAMAAGALAHYGPVDCGGLDCSWPATSQSTLTPCIVRTGGEPGSQLRFASTRLPLAAYMSGAAADAIIFNYTTEGDPVRYGVNIVSKERIKVNIQSHDRYGPQGSFAYVCQAMTRQPAAQLPGRIYLLLTGCSGPPDFLDGTRLTIP